MLLNLAVFWQFREGRTSGKESVKLDIRIDVLTALPPICRASTKSTQACFGGEQQEIWLYDSTDGQSMTANLVYVFEVSEHSHQRCFQAARKLGDKKHKLVNPTHQAKLVGKEWCDLIIGIP